MNWEGYREGPAPDAGGFLHWGFRPVAHCLTMAEAVRTDRLLGPGLQWTFRGVHFGSFRSLTGSLLAGAIIEGGDI